MPEAGYSATPLWRKLGLHEGDKVALLGAPAGFSIEGPVEATTSPRAAVAITVWFVRDRATLDRRMEAMATRAARSGLWIAWPKRVSTLARDLSDVVVRSTAIGHGLVDFKVCAIDGD